MEEYYNQNKRLVAYFVALFVISIGTLFMCSCSTVKYVPIETVTTEVVHKTDTVTKADSIYVEKETIVREARPEDSVMLARMGIKAKENERVILLLEKQLEKARSEVYERHDKDSVRVDSIQVPYPVEKPLSKWQKFCLDFGKVTTGISIAAIIGFLIWLFFKIKRRFFI